MAELKLPKEKAPKILKRTSFEEAEVDLTAFGLGLVMIKDPSMGQSAELDAFGRKQADDAGEIDLLDARAMELRAFVTKTTGFKKEAPSQTAALDAWRDWVKPLSARAVGRLMEAVQYFSREDFEEKKAGN